ncbi:hypothetical protein FA13DRAFT_1789946 [Coprinellus micaceus]|uniref:Kinetochore protein mis13 n=1 Tax=Coprinellus micaceus TaxID=71717 RepID=A0A4Y7THT9_COPMI|nr:hypothetical protein FA13DRAFT_1789946 [Coprinellus micaceus]
MAAAAAKRAKKDKANAAKRKLLPSEDAPGGLLIVHTPEPADLFTSQRPTSSQPQLSQSKPPSKKFRADSQPPAGSSRSTKPPSHSQSLQHIPRKPSTSSRLLDDEQAASHSDAEVERDVRAMEDEADRLRRQSRARALVDQSLLASTHSSSQSDNSMFNFPPPSTSKSQPKPAGANKSRNKLTITAMEVDTQVPIPQNETPQQQRNKRLREGAMAAIREDQEGEERGRDSGRGSGQRGISTSYQQTGVITQPHNTVSEASFYKHIDADLPEVERIRQLLIWCAMRAAPNYNKPPSPTFKPSLLLKFNKSCFFINETPTRPASPTLSEKPKRS